MSKFNPIRLFRNAQQAWNDLKETMDARRDLDVALREAQKKLPRATDSTEIINLRCRQVLIDITGKSREEIVAIHFHSGVTYEELYRWYCTTGEFPSEGACIGIKHFGVDVILKAISAADRDNT